MYSLSSCWNSHRHTDGRAMLREIRDLGFEFAELSHGIRLSLLPGILEAVDAGEIRISTLHNFCPLPIGVQHANPNVYRFSSPDPRERETAFRHTLKTFDTAQRVHASLVVLHLGNVELKDYTDKLLEMAGRGLRDTPKYERLCADVLERRERRKEPAVEAVYEVLRRLVPEAESRGLRLGIENREALEEIPFETDFPLFFREFSSPAVCYWHDTGHAQIKENLGFIVHSMHLGAMADRLAGFHIHDVQPPGRDHRPPGTGCIDFAALKRWLRPEHLKVFEFSPSVSPEEVRSGVDFIKRVWGET
jgi:sugar phosphate isomerase/epimerase